MSPTSQRAGALPRYLRIYESLSARIRSGELKIGDRLESERELASLFQVTQMTVRQALQLLERDGLVQRRHGAGTFVRRPRFNWNRLMSFTEQIAARGLPCASRLLSSAAVRADESTAGELGFEPEKARQPLDPKPLPRMDDPRVLLEQHRR